MQMQRGLSLLEVLIVLVIVALAIGILLPALGTQRRTARSTSNSTQARGIHTGLVLYAQGNNMYYPGLNSDGGFERPLEQSDCSVSVECRFQDLLYDNYFTGEYAISPAETRTPWTTGAVVSTNISYAMLQVDAKKRLDEWRETSNSQAPVLGDRARRNGTGMKSVHTNPGTNTTEWRGSIGYNDNHVSFESDNTVDTVYGSASSMGDDLFFSTGTNDALLIAAGTNQVTVD